MKHATRWGLTLWGGHVGESVETCPLLRASPQLVQGLRVALGVAVGVFALTALRWVEEAKEWVRKKTKKDQ